MNSSNADRVNLVPGLRPDKTNLVATRLTSNKKSKPMARKDLQPRDDLRTDGKKPQMLAIPHFQVGELIIHAGE
jgi:hypothetical protein